MFLIHEGHIGPFRRHTTSRFRPLPPNRTSHPSGAITIRRADTKHGEGVLKTPEPVDYLSVMRIILMHTKCSFRQSTLSSVHFLGGPNAKAQGGE